MLWIAIVLPALPLETCAAAPELPLAVCDARTVLLANRAARAAGVRAGLKRATALALCPTLAVRTRSAAQELEALKALAGWAGRFTPSVSLVLPDEDSASDAVPAGLLLEVQGSLRLFGGLASLLKQVRAGLVAQGHFAQLAVAPVAQAAWILARAQDGLQVLDPTELLPALSPHPVWLLGPGRAHWEALRGIGVASVGDLLRLPRSGVARRFSPRLLDETDRALGRKPDPREWFEPPLVFDLKLELAARVDHAEALLFGARRLLVQLSGWLAARHAATRQLAFTLWHDDRPPTPLLLNLADPSRDEGRFSSLLREVLSRTRLAAPVYELALRCEAAEASSPLTGELFPRPGSAQEGLMRLVERLQARLGREGIQRLALHADHRPEQAYRSAPLTAPSITSRRPAIDAGSLPARPLWLLPRPLPLAERNAQPMLQGPLTLVAGPERIEAGWWDAACAERDYFVARDDKDALHWVFRLRRPDPEAGSEAPGWFLHGSFG